jgi:hypothetical protein
METPVITNIIDRVVSMSEIPSLIIRNELISPIVQPTASGIIIANAGCSSHIIITFAAITAAKDAVAAVERSKPSTVNDIVIASAIRQTIDTDLKMFVMFPKVNQFSTDTEKYIIARIVTIIVPYLYRNPNISNFPLLSVNMNISFNLFISSSAGRV